MKQLTLKTTKKGEKSTTTFKNHFTINAVITIIIIIYQSCSRLFGLEKKREKN